MAMIGLPLPQLPINAVGSSATPAFTAKPALAKQPAPKPVDAAARREDEARDRAQAEREIDDELAALKKKIQKGR
jgi:hypothetical protein